MKTLFSFVILLAIATSALPQTIEAPAERIDFWREFDIVFWQTLPFVTFWGYLIGSQLGPVNWDNLLLFSVSISAGNAYLSAKKSTAEISIYQKR